ncbi:zinc-binding alcohol dehydrogenase family protein [Verrucomicrobiaceae bacterium N1E253]|uniref:Zinc-type alcohol dehydrogenase-like protein n=1 Tax=Oceaniferula marina TaxID=2748318 RepID=A0A851GHT9_9BACT|nr:zinc-binding alcohol dehydrogenase family protein [Oceaniferula marina]NWK55431.1 zinc-binding alcohol dehydrogenase family protein [Oceaniferula marina]
MKAVGYTQSLAVDQADALIDMDLPKPEAKGRDLLVKVEAVSVNPVDTKVRMRSVPEEGAYKVLGWDASGVVEAVGDGVADFQVGDKVWYAGALDRQGTNAEYHLVDERIVGQMPESLGFVESAAMPLTSITAWEMLFDRFGLTEDSGGTLLIIGAAGGVGSMMTQLAKRLTGLTVIGTASRENTVGWVKSLGADHVINHHQPFTRQLEKIGISSVDYVASLTHTGSHVAEIVECISPQGQFGLIDDPDELDVMPFKLKSVSIHWELMFTRSLFQTEDMHRQGELLNAVAEMVDAGDLQTTLAESFGSISASNLLKAHALLESGKSVGKIVLSGFAG